MCSIGFLSCQSSKSAHLTIFRKVTVRKQWENSTSNDGIVQEGICWYVRYCDMPIQYILQRYSTYYSTSAYWYVLVHTSTVWCTGDDWWWWMIIYNSPLQPKFLNHPIFNVCHKWSLLTFQSIHFVVLNHIIHCLLPIPEAYPTTALE